MAFHEVQFPPSISLGARGGPKFSTTVIEMSSGAEQRNVNWPRRRASWDVAHGLKTDEQIEQLLQFFHARQGKAYGFRFKDWGDYRLPRWINTPGDLFAIPAQVTTNGALHMFQITKTYGDGAATYTRQIVKPVAGTITVYSGALPLTPSTDYTVNTATGIVTLSSALTASSGNVISVSCEFDTPARFDTDEMLLSVNDVDNFSWPQIPVVEIFDAT